MASVFVVPEESHHWPAGTPPELAALASKLKARGVSATTAGKPTSDTIVCGSIFRDSPLTLKLPNPFDQ